MLGYVFQYISIWYFLASAHEIGTSIWWRSNYQGTQPGGGVSCPLCLAPSPVSLCRFSILLPSTIGFARDKGIRGKLQKVVFGLWTVVIGLEYCIRRIPKVYWQHLDTSLSSSDALVVKRGNGKSQILMTWGLPRVNMETHAENHRKSHGVPLYDLRPRPFLGTHVGKDPRGAPNLLNHDFDIWNRATNHVYIYIYHVFIMYLQICMKANNFIYMSIIYVYMRM